MKIKRFFVLMVIGWAFFTSCEELEGLLDEFGATVETDYYEVDLVIPPAPSGIEVSVHNLIQSDLDDVLAQKGFPGATINTIKVLDASLLVTENSPIDNLDAIETVRNGISTEALPEAIIASCKNTTPGAVELPMDTPDTDLSDYMVNDEYTLTTYGMLKENTTDTLCIRGKIRYQLSLTVNTQ
jgi:hypothetical protein